VRWNFTAEEGSEMDVLAMSTHQQASTSSGRSVSHCNHMELKHLDPDVHISTHEFSGQCILKRVSRGLGLDSHLVSISSSVALVGSMRYLPSSLNGPISVVEQLHRFAP